MGAVVLTHVNKIYHGDVHAVRDVNLTIEDREFVVFVGPSGCGKTTTLRMIAGLETISSGEILIDGRVVNDIDPQDRNISMVFQNYALYPHKTVLENMQFGLKLRGLPKPEIDRRVGDAAGVLGLSQLLARRPGALSGGQRQRVALGRAIVRQPSVFLFDEPLSNLDARLRHQMRTELAKLHARLRTTMIYVTHDQLEAMTLGDRIVVMKGGEIQQVGTPIEIYDHPKTRFVAAFIGAPEMNFLSGRIADRGGDLHFECEGAGLKLSPEQSAKVRGAALPGRDVTFGIRPQDIYDKLFTQGAPDDRKLTGKIEVVEPVGSETYLELSVGGQVLTARVPAKGRYTEQQQMELILNMDASHVFNNESEQAVY